MWRASNPKRSITKLLKLPSWVFALGLVFGLGAYASVLRDTASIPGNSKTLTSKVLPLTIYRNWGIENADVHSHIHALEAWKLEEGSHNVVVAVIDTGVDVNHPDLAGNIWHMVPKPDATKMKGAEYLTAMAKWEKNENHNTYGWDFVKNGPNPPDEHGHGTHVSGIIGALANPRAGISGVAHKVSIMPIRYYSESNPGALNLANTVKAIEWAVEHGANIINYSGGGPEFSEAEYLALRKAELKGILVVAAAGNERQNTDKIEHYYYPAAYRLSNIISVAATDRGNNLIASSNWGKTRVDVAAPGDAIYSTLPGKRYGQMSGTSQATAFVTGIAALLLAKDPSLKPAQIRQIIVDSVDKFPQLREKVASGGRVDAYQAVLSLTKPLKPVIAMPIRMASQSPVAVRVPAEGSQQ